MSLAISVENISKLYHLGNVNRGLLLRDCKRWLRHKLQAGKTAAVLEAKDAKEDETLFWALKDVSFEIKEGETVGIVGRNGAGKSTLLKILSRITAPSSGIVKIKGRVGSLLEIGTGFHPELSGRDNLFLYGSIMGMGREEIKGKFDDIVSFSELEKFIDTPVKRYSSGMYVRLAFSVAAFLEPEILIVDEALSVGDQLFQDRCMERIGQIIAEGRTLIFVSHGASLVQQLCKRSICLKNGQIICDDESSKALAVYQASLTPETADSSLLEAADIQEIPSAPATPSLVSEVRFPEGSEPGDEVVKICHLRAADMSGNTFEEISSKKEISIEMEFRIEKSGYLLRPAAYVTDESGHILFWTCDGARELQLSPRDIGVYKSQFILPGEFLAPGKLKVSAGIGMATANGGSHALVVDAIGFKILDEIDPYSVRGAYEGPLFGLIRPRLNWKTIKI